MIQSAERASTGWYADFPASRADFNNRGPHGSYILHSKILARKAARCEPRDYRLDRAEIPESSVGKAQRRLVKTGGRLIRHVSVGEGEQVSDNLAGQLRAFAVSVPESGEVGQRMLRNNAAVLTNRLKIPFAEALAPVRV